MWEMTLSQPLKMIMSDFSNFLEENADAQSNIIRSAINYALGYDDWSIPDIRHRCRIHKYAHLNVERFVFDNVELVEFRPFEFEVVASEDGFKMKSSQDYKLLYEQ